MDVRKKLSASGIAALLIVLSVAGPADAAFQLITNGDFEDGFSGWTTAVQSGSRGGWFVQTGTTNPLGGFTVQAPPGPTHAAMSDGTPGSLVLYQDFLVPQDGIAPGLTATLSFDRFIANQPFIFGTPPFNPLNTLDYTAVNNRQARVDILSAGSDPFSLVPGQLLLNLYTTQVGDPNLSGYTTQTADLTALLNAHSGQTLRLRFAEVSNYGNFVRIGPLNFGVDRVSLQISAPEPMSLNLLIIGLLGLMGYAWRHRDEPKSPGDPGLDGPVSSPLGDPDTR